MANQDAKLVAEVQHDALDAKVPLADTLRKLVALGGAVGSNELREWAGLELRGYVGSPVELPTYRKIPAMIEINGFAGAGQINGYRISPHLLPDFATNVIKEEAPLTSSVAELEAMVRHAASEGGYLKLSLPEGQSLVAIMNSEGRTPLGHIAAIYWSTSAPALEGALDQIRTSLVELVAEMRAGMPNSAGVPSRDAADRAVSIVIHGGNPNVNVTAASASGSGSHNVSAEGTLVAAPKVEAAWPALREELTELGVPDDELEELHQALMTDGDPGGELGPAAMSWIGKLTTKVSTGAIGLAGAASTEIVSHAILKALGLG